MCCNHDASTTVAAHSNQLAHGKAMGLKAHDFMTVWLCSACHAWLDQGGASKHEKHAAFNLAHGRQVKEWERLEVESRSGVMVNPSLNYVLTCALTAWNDFNKE
jgi:hypothetical protein